MEGSSKIEHVNHEFAFIQPLNYKCMKIEYNLCKSIQYYQKFKQKVHFFYSTTNILSYSQWYPLVDVH
jgi:hypothetical protein